MSDRPPNYGQKIFSFTNTKKAHYDVYIRKPDKRIYGDDCNGLCFDPQEKDPHILINPKQSDRAMLNTCIHEICHAFFWDKPEYIINRYANTVSNLIFKMGWRKVEGTKGTPLRRKGTKVRKDKK